MFGLLLVLLVAIPATVFLLCVAVAIPATACGVLLAALALERLSVRNGQ